MKISTHGKEIRFWRIALIDILAIFLLGIAMARIATAQTPFVTIDFETAPGPDGVLGTLDDVSLTEGTVIDTQFSSLGVVFSSVQGGNPFIATEGLPAVAFSGPGPDTPAVSGMNTLTDGVSTAFDGTAPFEADIAASFTASVNFVSLSLIDFRGDCQTPPPITATLNAFDAQGDLVASDSFTATSLDTVTEGNHVLLQVMGVGIVRVELAGTTADCGTAIDDFGFVPAEMIVEIDVKPGSFPNSINLSSAGVIPVAILSSATFDATTEVDPSKLFLAGAKVRVAGKSDQQLCHTEEINGDAFLDLVCQFENDLNATVGDSIAVLEGETYDGTPIRGEDMIRIVPDE